MILYSPCSLPWRINTESLGKKGQSLTSVAVPLALVASLLIYGDIMTPGSVLWLLILYCSSAWQTAISLETAIHSSSSLHGLPYKDELQHTSFVCAFLPACALQRPWLERGRVALEEELHIPRMEMKEVSLPCHVPLGSVFNSLSLSMMLP